MFNRRAYQQHRLLGRFFKRVEGRFGVEEGRRVRQAVDSVLANGVPWLKLLEVIGPLLLALISGGTLTLPAILSAILALIGK